MTPDETSRVLTRLRAGYDKRISDDTYQIWCEELAPLDFSPAWGAVRAIIHDSKFMPAISEFLDAYRNHAARQEPHHERQACRSCDDSGWFMTDATANEVIPCSTCRAEAFQMWNRGERPRTKDMPTQAWYAPRSEYDRPDTDTGVRARLEAIRDQLPTARLDAARAVPRDQAAS